MDRSSYRYEPRADYNAELREEFVKLARQKPRYGYPRWRYQATCGALRRPVLPAFDGLDHVRCAMLHRTCGVRECGRAAGWWTAERDVRAHCLLG
jgi:hypothetical protein